MKVVRGGRDIVRGGRDIVRSGRDSKIIDTRRYPGEDGGPLKGDEKEGRGGTGRRDVMDVDRDGTVSAGERVLFFFMPIIVAAVYCLFLWLVLPFDQAWPILVGMVGYSFTPAGPEIVVPLVTRQVMEAGGDSFWHPAIVAFSLAFVDMVFAMFFMWNFDLLLKIPYLGPWMQKVERMGRRKFEARPWVYRFALVGLILYTAFPFQGSGGAVGSIFGRILGMEKKRVFVAIICGACLGAFPFAYLAYYGMGAVSTMTREQQLLGGVLIFAIIIAAMIYLGRIEEERFGDASGGNGKTESGDGVDKKSTTPGSAKRSPGGQKKSGGAGKGGG